MHNRVRAASTTTPTSPATMTSELIASTVASMIAGVSAVAAEPSFPSTFAASGQTQLSAKTRLMNLATSTPNAALLVDASPFSSAWFAGEVDELPVPPPEQQQPIPTLSSSIDASIATTTVPEVLVVVSVSTSQPLVSTASLPLLVPIQIQSQPQLLHTSTALATATIADSLHFASTTLLVSTPKVQPTEDSVACPSPDVPGFSIIIGAVVGVCFSLVIFGALLWFFGRRCKSRQSASKDKLAPRATATTIASYPSYMASVPSASVVLESVYAPPKLVQVPSAPSTPKNDPLEIADIEHFERVQALARRETVLEMLGAHMIVLRNDSTDTVLEDVSRTWVYPSAIDDAKRLSGTTSPQNPNSRHGRPSTPMKQVFHVNRFS
ncbi:hypothetical protein BC830DRAFT_1168025 [Chytriomyces sp. MP71]|nr:hypothetical protein BC830DRAFT_1168025 [Chytriomyces sp. MP71]